MGSNPTPRAIFEGSTKNLLALWGKGVLVNKDLKNAKASVAEQNTIRNSIYTIDYTEVESKIEQITVCIATLLWKNSN